MKTLQVFVKTMRIYKPSKPFFAGLIDFSGFKGGNFRGLASDTTPQLIAISGMQTQRLYIGQHNKLFDNGSIAPICTLVDPNEGTQVVEGSTISVNVSAIDDVLADKVVLTVDGEDIGDALNSPFNRKLVLPMGAGKVVTLGARAIDLAGNVGLCAPVPLILIEDPKTTVTGKVVDSKDAPVEDATVKVHLTQLQAKTNAQGAFSIENISSTKPFNLLVSAEFNGKTVGAGLGPLKPDPYTSAPIDVGTIVLAAEPTPVFMGPVVSSPLLFHALDSVYGETPPTHMGPVSSPTVLFGAYTNSYPADAPSHTGPIASAPVLFEAFESSYPVDKAFATGPVVSQPLVFEAFTGAYPSTINQGCGLLKIEGCCDGATLKYCEVDTIASYDCANAAGGDQGAPSFVCGWVAASQVYDCSLDSQSDPSGKFPIECPKPGFTPGKPTHIGPIISSTILFEAVTAKDQCNDLTPCQNNGLCTNDSSPDGFTCKCSLGFGGELCEVTLCNFDGQCNIEKEGCAACEADCGSCCCNEGGGPLLPLPGAEATWLKGCGNSNIEACVCAKPGLDTCCTDSWTKACVDAAEDCGVICFNPFGP